MARSDDDGLEEVSDDEYADAADDDTTTNTATKRKRSMPSKEHCVKSSAAKVDVVTGSDCEDAIVYRVDDMFSCMARSRPDLGRVVNKLKSAARPIRVATMCSGTESPLWALRMLSKACVDQYGSPIPYEHVFSCEIEAFKQSFIERNCAPPLLFGDIRELGEDLATTAYGALEPVPDCVDLLIAGTSCVDYSALNNHGKGIDDGGESGQTFRGMELWIKKTQPAVVILENVCGAPWEKICTGKLEPLGYSCAYMRMDAKQYYIPHTRTRVYLVATLGKGTTLPRNILESARSMRSASVPSIDSFLLPNDDERLNRVRRMLSERKRAGCSDWSKCEARHQRCREEDAIGSKRPFTGWLPGGDCLLPDHAWNEWAKIQPERVLDLLDINMLKDFKNGADPSGKTKVWNLSQNVDRNSAGTRAGLCPCLTPTMIPFVTNRGGPLIGIEALMLQGIPVDDVLLTRESEEQMADLAGNAMTSTVVGAVICSTLCLALEHIFSNIAAKPLAASPLPAAAQPATVVVAFGRDSLVAAPICLRGLELEPLLLRAAESGRLCETEGAFGTCASILFCPACNHTVSKEIAGRPEHQYIELECVRTPPALFKRDFVNALPKRLTLTGISSQQHLPAIALVFQQPEESEFLFKSVHRGKYWRAFYASSSAELVLTLRKDHYTWDISLTHSSLGRLRSISRTGDFRSPTLLSKNSLEAEWTVLLQPKAGAIIITGGGEQVDSFQARIGLVNPVPAKRFESFEISCEGFPQIDGVYTYLPNCGGLMGSLHSRADCAVFLFLDQSPLGDGADDCFVFAREHAPLARGETRGDILARMPASWRPGSAPNETVSALVFVRESLPGALLEASSAAQFEMLLPAEMLLASLDPELETRAFYIAGAAVEGDPEPSPESGCEWSELDFEHSAKIAWLLSCLRPDPRSLVWQVTALDGAEVECCSPISAPLPPRILWTARGGSIEPVEDSRQAAVYERAIKARPKGFVAERFGGRVRIGACVNSLVRRAIAELGSAATATTTTPVSSVAWRVVESSEPGRARDDVTFAISSNREDPQASQPPHFVEFPLRPEQLRSLSWMIAQEDARQSAFEEEEVVESELPFMHWRLETKAVRSRVVLGGILMDQVGYGKTAITIGLIDSAPTPKMDERALHAWQHRQTTGAGVPRIPTNATLIVVPSHLLEQWPSEVSKFAGSSIRRVIVIKTIASINSVSISEIMAADIVLVGTTVLRGDLYYERLAAMAGNSLPMAATLKGGGSVKNARCFSQIYQRVVERLQVHTEVLTRPTGGIAALREAIRDEELKSSLELSGMVVEQGSRKGGGGKGSKKVTAKENTAPPAKEKKPAAIIGAGCVRWESLKSVPLEMFHWARVVVDEFSYFESGSRERVMVTQGLSATVRWCLSATPCLSEFDDILNIADFMRVRLGVAEISNKTRAGSCEYTSSEVFRSYSTSHSADWYERRSCLAQAFLDRFARQNRADIGEIPSSCVLERLTLKPAERAIYLELENHIDAMQLKQMSSTRKCGGSDREARVRAVLGKSESAQEALLKRCAYFDLESSGKSASEVCDAIVDTRQKQLDACVEELRLAIAQSKVLLAEACSADPGFSCDLKLLGQHDPSAHFARWLVDMQSGSGCGDPDATLLVRGMLMSTAAADAAAAPASEVNQKKKKAKASSSAEPPDAAVQGAKWALRLHTHDFLRPLCRELTSRMRSLRYFQSVRAAQTSIAPEDGEDEDCLLSCCGHVGSMRQLRECISTEECYVERCAAIVRPESLVRSSQLGSDSSSSTATAAAGGGFGTKLDRIVAHVRAIPEGEQVLIFVQYDDLMSVVANALGSGGVNAKELRGSVYQKLAALSGYQAGEFQCLLLNIGNESSAGANLTCANHIIYLSPIFADTTQMRVAWRTQSTGRALRFGQTKIVSISDFVVDDTIDSELV